MEVKKVDFQVAKIIKLEKERQKKSLEMIPSENHCSKAVREALGSVLTDKYAEGYPRKRYYAGLNFYDELEILCQERAKRLFGVPYVNVQPYSGSPANQAVYFALLEPGDRVMGMALPMGGHLTHGWKVNFSGKLFKVFQYGVDEKTHLLDYRQIEKLAKEVKPKVIWVGATAYPRIFDWQKLGEIADSVNAYLVADIAHIAGLIVGGVYPSPVSFVHLLTTTTHKTLRGPRGGMIMVTEKGLRKDPQLGQKIDKAVFPGLQGGPHMNNIAAIAICLKEASRSSFKKYACQVVRNAQTLARELKKYGFNLITGGTDTHLILVDLTSKGILGGEAQLILEKVGIIVNKNTVPYDPQPPFNPSGIRLGTPALTTRGMKENEMKIIARLIYEALTNKENTKKLKEVKKEVINLCRKFPLSL